MNKTDKAIPQYILKDLQERLTDNEIKDASAEFLFKEYCRWHGLGEWGESLIEVIDVLRDCRG